MTQVDDIKLREAVDSLEARAVLSRTVKGWGCGPVRISPNSVKANTKSCTLDIITQAAGS